MYVTNCTPLEHELKMKSPQYKTRFVLTFTKNDLTLHIATLILAQTLVRELHRSIPTQPTVLVKCQLSDCYFMLCTPTPH